MLKNIPKESAGNFERDTDHVSLNLRSREYSASTMHTPENISVFQRILQVFTKVFFVFKFVVVSTFIFAFILAALNFHAYKQIALSFINPEAVKKAEVALENSVKEVKKDQVLLNVEKKRKEIKKRFPPIELKVTPPSNRLIIPKIGKNIPITRVEKDFVNIEDQGLIGKEIEGAIQDALKNGVVHYPGTAAPAQYGNFFVTGHSSYYPWDSGQYKDVFALLDNLQVGDEYYVYYDQNKYTYKVFDKKEVSPGEVSILDQPKDKKLATLMTCTPVGTALRRLVIIAELIENNIHT